MLAAVYLLLLVDAFLVVVGGLALLGFSVPPLITALRRKRRRRIPMAIIIAGCLALPGCLADDECAADDQAEAPPCERGLVNASLWSERPMNVVLELCESIGEGETCVALCSIYGLGLVCDRDGCESQGQW